MSNKIQFSPLQKEAIFSPTQNIIISAGAGSGKTAVLTARITRLLTDGVQLKNLIVLTFTNAAAHEMKERVRKALKDEIATGKRYLQSQLDYIDQANIQTFDAFSLSLVKQYHYLLDLPRDISIADATFLVKLKQEVMEDVFVKLYQEKNPDFFLLLTAFAKKNDKDLQTLLLQIMDQFELLVDTQQAFRDYANTFLTDAFITQAMDEYLESMIHKADTIEGLLDDGFRIFTEDDEIEHIKAIKESVFDCIHAKTYQQFQASCDVTLPRMPSGIGDFTKVELNRIKDKIKELLKNLKQMTEHASIEALQEQLKDSFQSQSSILHIVEMAYAEYLQRKKSLEYFSFMDIAKYAIELFVKHENLRIKYRNKTSEILIDEYQDTSDLQEYFISLIANQNVYVVGDIKQSIYRFRNANPKIFRTKYLTYQMDNKGKVIELFDNYRSREEVLQGINHVFQSIMSHKYGGIYYSDGQRLEYGNKAYEVKEKHKSYGVKSLVYTPDETYDVFKHHELEAFIIANDIKRRMKDKDTVLGKEGLRPVRYNDFAILTMDKTKFEDFKKIFEYLQVPLSIHKADSFINSDEIYVVKNILRMIHGFSDTDYYKSYFKESLVSLLRSFLVEESDIVISRLASLDPMTFLKEYRKDMYNKLHDLYILSQNEPLHVVLGSMYQTFEIFAQLIKIGNIDFLETKLLFFVEKAKELERNGYDLLKFIHYLEWMIENKQDIEFEERSDISQNTVHMMSIHKSKGLEFGICYYPQLEKRFQMQELKERIFFSKEYGIIAPTFAGTLKQTILKTLYKESLYLDEISEKVRLFYVALTRAKEEAILVHPKLPERIYPKVNENMVGESKCFLDFIELIGPYIRSISEEVFLSQIELNEEYKWFTKSEYTKESSQETIQYRDVSLIRLEKEVQTASHTINQLMDATEKAKLDAGTKLHEVFEALDFSGNIKEQIQDYDLSAYEEKKIEAFFAQPFMQNLHVVNTYKEYTFRLEMDSKFVDGIIDLILETKDTLIVIDYKLKDITKPQYVEQVQTYMTYLKNVSKKEIQGFIYSIIDGKYIEV